jgi:hypothetical protein
LYVAQDYGNVLGINALSGVATGKYKAIESLSLDTLVSNGTVYFVGTGADGVYMFGLPDK